MLDTETVVLTEEIFRQAMSRNGGLSNKQLAQLGVSASPLKGWKHKIIGKEYPRAAIEKFISLKDNHLPPKGPDGSIAEQPRSYRVRVSELPVAQNNELLLDEIQSLKAEIKQVKQMLQRQSIWPLNYHHNVLHNRY